MSGSRRRGPYAKTAQRRVEIVEAATTVFATNGYHGGSLRDIARELGMSLTTVVHHFPTKSDLLEAVLENADRTGGVTDFGNRVAEVGLADAIMGIMEFNLSRPELLRLLAILSSEASAPDHPAHDWFVKRYDAVRLYFAGLIVGEQETGRIASAEDATAIAHRILAMWDGLQLSWLLDPRQDMLVPMRRFLDQSFGAA